MTVTPPGASGPAAHPVGEEKGNWKDERGIVEGSGLAIRKFSVSFILLKATR